MLVAFPQGAVSRHPPARVGLLTKSRQEPQTPQLHPHGVLGARLSLAALVTSSSSGHRRAGPAGKREAPQGVPLGDRGAGDCLVELSPAYLASLPGGDARSEENGSRAAEAPEPPPLAELGLPFVCGRWPCPRALISPRACGRGSRTRQGQLAVGPQLLTGARHLRGAPEAPCAPSQGDAALCSAGLQQGGLGE